MLVEMLAFHSGSKYVYCFIVKELAETFKGQFESIRENKEKYLTFSVSINKKLENGKTITYKIRFIDSFRYMSSSLSSFVDNFLKDHITLNAKIVSLVCNV